MDASVSQQANPLLNQSQIPSLSQSQNPTPKPNSTAKISPSRTPQVQRQHDDNSDSEAGGIQMIDNESDGELVELEHMPEPEPDEPTFDSFKSTAGDEQKVLGSFERVKKVSAADMGLY